MENRKVFMNQHNNLLELRTYVSAGGCGDSQHFFVIYFRMMRFQRLRSMTESCLITCRMKSGLPIRHSVMGSNRERRIPQSRLLHCMIIFTDLVVQKKVASANFSYSKKDRDAVYKCMERGYEFPEVTSWIVRARKIFGL